MSLLLTLDTLQHLAYNLCWPLLQEIAAACVCVYG